MPDIPGFSIAARSTTCYEVGGDYLDSISLPDGTHLMVVADVAGKGLASAIVATSFRSALRSLAGQLLPLEELAARMNHLHWEEGAEAQRRYVTAVLLRLRADAGQIEIASAGHNPVVLVLPQAGIRMIESSGTPLGMLPGTTYSTETHPFPTGSRILLYTDGLTEVFCDEEEFGSERLSIAFRDSPFLHAERTLDYLWEKLASFSSNAPQADDMTRARDLPSPFHKAGVRQTMKSGSSVYVHIPSELGFEKVAMSTAASMAGLMGFSGARIEGLKTAVAEACINAIEHGNGLNSSLSVGVVLSTTDDQLEVKVLDDGAGVLDKPAAPDIDRKLHGEENPRGMGMFLIQALVDEAEWHQGPPAEASCGSSLNLTRRTNKVQATTKTSQRTATAASQDPVSILAFSGDISSASKDAILDAYHGLPDTSSKVLLDFTGVDYINSSGIAIIIQILIEAGGTGKHKIGIFGLSPHFQKVFAMVGINKYAVLHTNESVALTSF